jgi:hypothetical protein
MVLVDFVYNFECLFVGVAALSYFMSDDSEMGDTL